MSEDQTWKQAQRAQHMRLDFPLPYTVSLGAFRCNRSCRMCPMHNMPPEAGKETYITREVFNKAIDDIGNHKVDLELSAFGEPTLHPDFLEFLSIARKKSPQAHIVVNTNGVVLDEKMGEAIIDSGLDQLVFSLDAGSAQTYKWLTGSDSYEEVCRNLETLCELKQKRNARHLAIQTHIIGIKELEHEFKPFIERWRDIVDYAYVRSYGNWAGLVDNNGITPCVTQKVPPERYPCAWLWYATKIEPNGDVSKCFVHVVGDSNPVGNIMRQDFAEIWKGEKILELRQKHLTGKWDELEFCKNCIVWSLFPNFWEKAEDSPQQIWK